MTIYSYEIGEEFNGTGTAQSTTASKDVVGTGSAFDTEFAARYLIVIAGETRIVDTITDATHLAVTENFTVGSGGGAVVYTGVNMVNVESLTTPLNAPKSTFVEYSRVINLGDGSIRGMGWPTASWRFGFLATSQRDQLRTFCALASNDVYIRTRKNDTGSAYQYYSCQLVWPIGQEDKDHGFRLDFVAEFRDLTLVTTT